MALPDSLATAAVRAEPAAAARAQAGSIRGLVYDADFDAPLGGALVTIVETGAKVFTTEQGNFVFTEVPAGHYTLVFAKEGYVRQVKADVAVEPGQLTELVVSLAGEFTEMDEFVVQEILELSTGTETALLELRFESPALLDSISADLMSRAGASDAAGALRLVTGATVQDGKFAVIRGLPDRFVSSQMNGVRLPSADEDKRAVELDQFPTAVIESIQVTKTFTPDQQGDASGGAVNVLLRGIPDETSLTFKAQTSYNSNVTGRSDFLTYDGGGVNLLGKDDGDRDIQYDAIGTNWDGAVGVSRDDAPIDYKWALDAGWKHELESGLKLGAFASLFYERDSSFYDDGVEDSWWVLNPGDPMTPEVNQGLPGDSEFKTSLFDVTQGSQSVHWGGLGTLGLESENHRLGLTALYTHIAEDVATLAEDTRGKEFFFPGYDPDDPTHPGNNEGRRQAPYIRTETLEYTERDTGTLQLDGRHTLAYEGFELGSGMRFRRPELAWRLSRSFADMDQPDKRTFGAFFLPASNVDQPEWLPYQPATNFTVGNLQRTWKQIEEDSRQYALDLELPFEQWSGREGYVKLGLFDDDVERAYDQESFSNLQDPSGSFSGDFDDFWSDFFPDEDHPILDGPPFQDVDYDGEQDLSAWYGMLDLPVSKPLSVIGGVRFESTEISIVNLPEQDAQWIAPGEFAPTDFDPGEGDVAFDQDDVLPSIGLVFEPTAQLTLRGSYSETVARQTFKELSPILQQEFLGGPVFIGNPTLGMAALQNYDLRLDYVPRQGSLVSLSWFSKDVEDAIEYVQEVSSVGFGYTTPRNYPEGELSGYEVELRENLGNFREALDGLTLGANATFIDSEVTLPADEAAELAGIAVPQPTRDMTSAPDYLYNLYLTWEPPESDTQIGLFYSVQGDTLVAGAGTQGNVFVPSVYAEDYGTLNFSIAHRIGRNVKLQFQAKNLTDPEIEEVYRSDFIDGDVTKTSYTRGREYSLGLSINL